MPQNRDRHSETANTTDPELMVRIMEEAAELQQVLSKMIRFGILDRHPTYYEGRNNWEEFNKELAQFMNLYHELNRRVSIYEKEMEPALPFPSEGMFHLESRSEF